MAAMKQERWLEPLLAGDICTAFAMTEPDVASSDATNMQLIAVVEGDRKLAEEKLTHRVAMYAAQHRWQCAALG